MREAITNWYCDICGKQYEQPDRFGFVGPDKCEYYIEKLTIRGYEAIDLCPDCIEAFNRWLKERMKKNDI